MNRMLTTTPKAAPVETGVKSPEKISAILEEILADTYTLMIRTHAVHWNIEGPLFYSVHMLTEEQYNGLFSAADVLAERIRALGLLAPMTPKAVVDQADGDGKAKLTAGEMLESLKNRHEALARLCHDGIDAAEKARDPVTADLLTSRSSAHEKAAWMLRALLG